MTISLTEHGMPYRPLMELILMAHQVDGSSGDGKDVAINTGQRLAPAA